MVFAEASALHGAQEKDQWSEQGVFQEGEGICWYGLIINPKPKTLERGDLLHTSVPHSSNILPIDLLPIHLK